MKKLINTSVRNFELFIVLLLLTSCTKAQMPTETFLDFIELELQKKWPGFRTDNLIFHGHSVPPGYLTAGKVNRMATYPFQALKKVSAVYPYAEVNNIVPAMGSEQSEQGAIRFKKEVLTHKPDVFLIDYALNDHSIRLETGQSSLEKNDSRDKGHLLPES